MASASKRREDDLHELAATLGLCLRIDRAKLGAERWSFFDADSRLVADWNPQRRILALGGTLMPGIDTAAHLRGKEQS